eukprot:scpid104875/ scgid10398/ 
MTTKGRIVIEFLTQLPLTKNDSLDGNAGIFAGSERSGDPQLFRFNPVNGVGGLKDNGGCTDLTGDETPVEQGLSGKDGNGLTGASLASSSAESADSTDRVADCVGL